MPESVRRNLAASSGYGSVTGDHHGNSFFPNPLNSNTAIRFTHKPILSGICNSGKYMPLQFLGAGGLIWEWELGNAGDGVNTTSTNSQDWHISDIRVQASVINLNSALQEAYAAHVL